MHVCTCIKVKSKNDFCSLKGVLHFSIVFKSVVFITCIWLLNLSTLRASIGNPGMMRKEAAYILKIILIFFLYWLGIPFALKQAGFGMGIFLLIFTALVNGKIFEYNPQRFFFLPSEGAWTFSFLMILLMGSKTWHFVYSQYK